MAKRTLPSLNGLRAFETAARLGSLVAAAAELGVTAGAISQQVRALEDRLGFALFTRRPQSLAATRAGLALLPVLTEAFDAIDAALRRLAAPAAALPLRVACPAGFAASWLLPRLPRFQERAPGIALTLSATERLLEPGEGGDDAPDAVIRFGRAGWSGNLGCDFLLADRRIPLCSPAYLASHPLDAASPDPLQGHLLLEALSLPGDWLDWAQATGVAPGERRLSFGDERLAMEGALAGLGIALLDRALAQEALATGRLVAPLEPREMLRGTAWFLVYRLPVGEAVASFRAWLLDEIDPAVD
ncbi:MAG TPA: LysR substrate-binding domain-containing protein [Stellaceae bacterium]|nr:LysR substrate-binding domain-containing protein [Stellaceae bacterium]